MELSLLALTVLFIKGQLSAERWTPGCLVCRHFRIWDVQFLDFYCNLPNCNLIRLYVHYELILYFKVDLMTCPTSAILLLPALVLHQKTCSSCFVNIARIFQMASYLHTVNIRTFGFRHFQYQFGCQICSVVQTERLKSKKLVPNRFCSVIRCLGQTE